MGSPEVRALVNRDLSERAPVRETPQECLYVLGTFQGVEIPSQREVIPPVRLSEEEFRKAGIIAAIESITEGGRPLGSGAVDIDWLRRRYSGEVCYRKINRTWLDTVT